MTLPHTSLKDNAYIIKQRDSYTFNSLGSFNDAFNGVIKERQIS
jgi:hypothetical protein